MNETGTAELPAYYHQSRPELTQLVEAANLRVLEVGCAAGAMGAALLAKGAREVVGLDIFAPALVIARSRLSAVHQVDLDALPDLPYPHGHFDLFTFADVLEHLRDPAQVLRHLRRWLAPGGRILLSLPNVRHESVVLPLLVAGQWDYADSGILDRSHLRFFTRRGMENLLTCAGFEVVGKVAGSKTRRSACVLKAAELVAALGGDAARFVDECNVVQFVAFAAPKDRLDAQAHAMKEEEAQLVRPAESPTSDPGPWAGSRTQRVLLVPELGSADERWAEVLPRLTTQLSGDSGVTLGIALPVELHENHPAPLMALSSSLELDLLLMELPSSLEGWEALVRGATLVVLTAPQPELAALAQRLGVCLHDALVDPQLSGAVGAGTAREPDGPSA